MRSVVVVLPFEVRSVDVAGETDETLAYRVNMGNDAYIPYILDPGIVVYAASPVSWDPT